ncbi:coiled-coil-helix-coiled-coil-helix domain-containing protein 1-like [Dromiciops gliroides]|uniref:coiled-coil-helix-coiled-coil-helix domain-containing protein 1-like n=1 Tax=Dromiciops gliroides TaxID=33562 RepID=UPI001CC59220|nr:coiled-coil-helix-coiled-coil-helix domain-containing protein 1-like [Dromiciops gliroides]
MEGEELLVRIAHGPNSQRVLEMSSKQGDDIQGGGGSGGGRSRAVATPSLRGLLARLSNAKQPVLKPNKPLMLASRVGMRHRELGEATRVTEMSLMMACWKQNEFSDTVCAKEIKDFFDCASKAKAEWKQKAKHELLGLSGNLTPKQTNKLLGRFPNISYII